MLISTDLEKQGFHISLYYIYRYYKYMYCFSYVFNQIGVLKND